MDKITSFSDLLRKVKTDKNYEKVVVVTATVMNFLHDNTTPYTYEEAIQYLEDNVSIHGDCSKIVFEINYEIEGYNTEKENERLHELHKKLAIEKAINPDDTTIIIDGCECSDCTYLRVSQRRRERRVRNVDVVESELESAEEFITPINYFDDDDDGYDPAALGND